MGREDFVAGYVAGKLGASASFAPIYVIDAIIEFESVGSGENGKAAGWVDDNYTDEQLNSYWEFIINIRNTIVGFGFDIVGECQSDKSASYYFNFVPYDEDGEPMDVIMVRFRISDHPLRGGGDNMGVKSIFKSFWFGGEKYRDMWSLVLGVEDACRAIQRRDFGRLMLL